MEQITDNLLDTLSGFLKTYGKYAFSTNEEESDKDVQKLCFSISWYWSRTLYAKEIQSQMLWNYWCSISKER